MKTIQIIRSIGVLTLGLALSGCAGDEEREVRVPAATSRTTTTEETTVVRHPGAYPASSTTTETTTTRY